MTSAGKPTVVSLSHHNLPNIDFTPAEARELAAKLVELAELVSNECARAPARSPPGTASRRI